MAFFFNHSKKKKKSEMLHPATVTTCMLMEETPFAGNDGVKSLTLDLGTIRGAQVLRTLHVFFFFNFPLHLAHLSLNGARQ